MINTTVTTTLSSRILLTLGMAVQAILALVVSALPIGVAADIRWMPSVPLLVIFFWAVHRPDLFPRWLAFVTGLLQDLLSGGPLGLWALVYTCLYEGAFANRLFLTSRPALASLTAFAMAAMATALLAWAIASLYFWQLMSPMPVLAQALASIVLYPFLAPFLSMIDRWMGADR